MTGVQDVIELSRPSMDGFSDEASEAIPRRVRSIAAESITSWTNPSTSIMRARQCDRAGREVTICVLDRPGLVATVISAPGVGVGMYLGRDLSSRIASIVSRCRAGKRGPVAEVRRPGEKTEIGVMADALQVSRMR